MFQAGWSIPVDIVIGPPSQGIAYMTDSAVTVRANWENERISSAWLVFSHKAKKLAPGCENFSGKLRPK